MVIYDYSDYLIISLFWSSCLSVLENPTIFYTLLTQAFSLFYTYTISLPFEIPTSHIVSIG